MRQKIFAVFDSAAGLFLRPFFCRTTEEAIRSFRHIVQDREHEFGKFPEDYTLFELGEYDQESGKVESLNTPHSLGVAITFVDPSRHGEQMEMRDDSV